MEILSEEGIETRPFFIPLHQLPPFREESRRRGDQLQITESLSSTGMNLPTFVGLTAIQVERIAELIRRNRG